MFELKLVKSREGLIVEKNRMCDVYNFDFGLNLQLIL